jgi:hypothetical protein
VIGTVQIKEESTHGFDHALPAFWQAVSGDDEAAQGDWIDSVQACPCRD